jgi:hypothetical protein
MVAPPPPPKPTPAIREVRSDDAKKEVEGHMKEGETTDAKTEESQASTQKQAITTANPSSSPETTDAANYFKKTEEQKFGLLHSVGVKGNYASIWSHEATDLFRTERYGRYSLYTPNGYSIFETLHAMHRQLDENEHLRWSVKHYLSIPVTIYYGVLYWMRILHVREMLGLNNHSESQLVRRFSRTYRLESLPIAGPLIPAFNAIAAYASDDLRFNWLCPDLNFPKKVAPTTGASTNMSTWTWGDEFHTDGESRAALVTAPFIPMLIGMMKQFTDVAEGNFLRSEFADEDDNYVPIQLGSDQYFGGHWFPATARTADLFYLMSPGMDRPIVDSFDKMSECHRHWSASKFRQFAPDFPAGEAVNTITQFLGFTENMQWFSDCISMAAVQAKYFSGTETFADLDYQGGLEITMRTKIYFNDYPGRERPVNETQVKFYPMMTSLATAELTWHNNDVADVHKLNGRHTLLDSEIRFRTSTTGALPNYDVGYLINTTNRAYRYGPMYGSTTTKTGEPADSISLTPTYGSSVGKFDCLDRRGDLILRNFYLSKGE